MRREQRFAGDRLVPPLGLLHPEPRHGIDAAEVRGHGLAGLVDDQDMPAAVKVGANGLRIGLAHGVGNRRGEDHERIVLKLRAGQEFAPVLEHVLKPGRLVDRVLEKAEHLVAPIGGSDQRHWTRRRHVRIGRPAQNHEQRADRGPHGGIARRMRGTVVACRKRTQKGPLQGPALENVHGVVHDAVAPAVARRVLGASDQKAQRSVRKAVASATTSVRGGQSRACSTSRAREPPLP